MIGIVGAGLTGLSLGYLLKQRGIPFRILEASDRAGGVVRSSEVEGRILDHGPQRTRVTPPIAAMIRDLGLEDRVVTVPQDIPLFVLRGGRLRKVPFTARDLLQTDLLSASGKLRLLWEPMVGGDREDETVADYLTRRFGRESYENLMGPLFGGLYGSDPADMLVRHSLVETLQGLGVSRSILWAFLKGSFNRTAAPPAVSFRRGMAEFTEALWGRVRDEVSLGTPVAGLTQIPAGGWQLRTQRGEVLDCNQVVLTLEAEGAAGLIQGEVPDAADRLRQLRYNRLVMVHLAGAKRLYGLGYQVSYEERMRTRGVTWNASALDRGDVYTAFLGGARDPGALALEDAALGEIARREFQEVTGVEARVLSVGRTQVPSWDRHWTALDDFRLPAGLHLCTNYESRVGIPGRIARARGLAAALAGEPAPRPR
jgi:protoporphyrinogen/coproporphyrinogen III oxidase